MAGSKSDDKGGGDAHAGHCGRRRGGAWGMGLVGDEEGGGERWVLLPRYPTFCRRRTSPTTDTARGQSDKLCSAWRGALHLPYEHHFWCS